ncbi:hypothetical protein JD969_04655 [Planctomycetota bacterium]|nr:hypothetical protein JD969_04655 [Planctomycetota bacterium]
MKIRMYGFSVIEAIVVLVFLVFMFAIFLPMLGHVRHPARSNPNNMRVRGIHQSLVQFAQDNRGQYPGVDSKRKIFDATVEGRYELLLRGGWIESHYLVSTYDEAKVNWEKGVVTTKNYSFSLPSIVFPAKGRKGEWRENLNTLAPIVTDRNIGRDHDEFVQSIHEGAEAGKWKGSVVWQDNHVSFEVRHVLETKLSKWEKNEADNLFVNETEEGTDCYMIYTGQ